MKDNCQKIKLLKLYEYLKRESDEQHPLPTAELLAWLAEQGISCDRRTLTKDIEVLNGQGYEIMSRQMGHQKAYYVDDRSFSLPELKILMDAIQAAGFITEAKTAEFAAKIAELGGRHRAELLQRNTVRFNTRKHSSKKHRIRRPRRQVGLSTRPLLSAGGALFLRGDLHFCEKNVILYGCALFCDRKKRVL